MVEPISVDDAVKVTEEEAFALFNGLIQEIKGVLVPCKVLPEAVVLVAEKLLTSSKATKAKVYVEEAVSPVLV